MKADNVSWAASALSRADRRDALGHVGVTLWMVGLSGSGKSTLARALEQQLVRTGQPAFRLDGDNLRHGLCADLGFSPEDRTENLRRVAHTAALLAESGQVAIAAAISPLARHRSAAREVHAKASLPFVEVFIDAPLDICEGRDPKGLYAKARRGEIRRFTGIDDPFEAPSQPDLHIRTHLSSEPEALAQLVEAVKRAQT